MIGKIFAQLCLLGSQIHPISSVGFTKTCEESGKKILIEVIRKLTYAFNFFGDRDITLADSDIVKWLVVTSKIGIENNNSVPKTLAILIARINKNERNFQKRFSLPRIQLITQEKALIETRDACILERSKRDICHPSASLERNSATCS